MLLAIAHAASGELQSGHVPAVKLLAGQPGDVDAGDRVQSVEPAPGGGQKAGSIGAAAHVLRCPDVFLPMTAHVWSGGLNHGIQLTARPHEDNVLVETFGKVRPL